MRAHRGVQRVQVGREVQVEAQQRGEALQAREALRVARAEEVVHHLAHLRKNTFHPPK